MSDDEDVSAETTSDRLALLPDELLEQIFRRVGNESKRDLCSLSRLNRRYHTLADALLYKSISFDKPEHHLSFSESLSRRPRRCSIVEHVFLQYPSSELSHLILDGPIQRSHYPATRIDAMSRTISTMSNLETLEIAVPAHLLHGIGTLFNGPFDLAYLKTCSLFYAQPDRAYWDLQENIHIFAHPTLETLIIKRARLDDRGFDSLELPEATALKTLHLLECDISDAALSDVLGFPKGLKDFVMTQTDSPKPELEESSDDIGDYITALKAAAHSLEAITIDFPSLTGRKTLRMRDFAALRSLRMNWDYQLFGRTSKKPRLHSVGIPPKLEVLQFFNELGMDAEVTDLMTYTIESKDILARRLKTMVVVAGKTGVSREIVDACASHGLHLDVRET